ncbi:MAG: SCP2 sterol-binding domain-containing protein [Deltaproteobacteria bacterium]|nr:SCP2 sterol-binding domain-containing protein [Deltaproteobacteria bacterium]
MTVAEAMAKLESALASRPVALFQRVGGSIQFTVVTPTERQRWVARLAHGRVVALRGEAEDAVLHIGIIDRSLLKWLTGRLDVEEAFKKRRLAVEGDLDAFDRLIDCLSGGGSAVTVRAGGKKT